MVSRAAAVVDNRAAAPRSGTVLPDGRITFEEFLAWCDEDTRAEWIDGEVILLMPGSKAHQRLMVFLAFIMQAFAEAHALGEVLADFIMRLPSRPSGRLPDVLFVARDHLARVHDTWVDGPADLAVELVSPDSEDRDREEKLAEYAAARVPEYWLIDAEHKDAQFYRLGADGQYQSVPPDAQGVYRSASLLGFWLRVDWLWQEPLPQLQALQALGLLASTPHRNA